MRKIILLIWFLGFARWLKGQEGAMDSLLQLLPQAKDDTAKVSLLLKIANQYETTKQDSALYYLEKSRDLSESLKYQYGIFQYHQRVAIVSFTKGDYTVAMEHSNIALNHARLLKDSSLVIAMLNNISIVYAYLGDFESQLDYMLQVKNAVEATHDSAKFSGVYHNLGNSYNNLKRYRISADYCLLAVHLNNTTSHKNNYINRVYATLAQNYEAMNFYDSAMYFYNLAISESVRLNDQYAEATIYGYLSNLHGGRNEFEKMLKAAEKSLSLARELQSRQMMATALYDVAYANFFNGNNTIAKKIVNEALEIAKKDTLRDELKNSYIVLSYISARDGDFKTSSWAKRQYDSLEKAIFNDQVIQRTSEMEKKYEVEKKDKQIKLQQAQLDRRRILMNVLFGAIALVLIISILLYRNHEQKQRLQRQRINELEREKQLASAEAVLKGEEQERTRLAKDLHDGLGGMLSGIKYSFQTMKGNLIMTPDNAQAFERSIDMLDSSIQEMRRVAHNLMPEGLVKFGLDTALKDFCNDINRSGALQVNYQSIGVEGAVITQTTSITIYRIVQELINNVIKHAGAKSAIVQVTKTDGKFSLTVEDDGKGFDTAVLIERKGMGWNNIQSRVNYLKGKMDVQSETGKGTSILIELEA